MAMFARPHTPDTSHTFEAPACSTCQHHQPSTSHSSLVRLRPAQGCRHPRDGFRRHSTEKSRRYSSCGIGPCSTLRRNPHFTELSNAPDGGGEVSFTGPCSSHALKNIRDNRVLVLRNSEIASLSRYSQSLRQEKLTTLLDLCVSVRPPQEAQMAPRRSGLTVDPLPTDPMINNPTTTAYHHFYNYKYVSSLPMRLHETESIPLSTLHIATVLGWRPGPASHPQEPTPTREHTGPKPAPWAAKPPFTHDQPTKITCAMGQLTLQQKKHQKRPAPWGARDSLLHHQRPAIRRRPAPWAAKLPFPVRRT